MRYQILTGDCRATLATLPAASVQCCVTSPPYWGLRDYGTAEQIGLEPTPDAYVAALVGVFREVRRVLADDGVCWLNLGSSYFGAKGGDTHTGFNERYFGKQFNTDKQAMTPFPGGNGDTPATPSPRARRVPACDTDGTGLQDSTVSDSACFGLCDGCLADYLTHRDRIAGIAPRSEQYAPPLCTTGRDSAQTDCAPSLLAASLPDVPASTTLGSWRQHRGACSRCDSRASALSVLHSSSADAQACAGMSWLNYTTRLKQKDLVPIPWLVAMALQADGWYLRSDVIWAKPNPMPESVTDRPTKSHEYVFLLSKSERYYYDAAAIAEPGAEPERVRRNEPFGGANGASVRHGAQSVVNGTMATRNARTVWNIATQPYRDAHFAVMPEALAARCVMSGSLIGDTVLDPFAGAGTTGVAALSNGRSFIGCEANAAYVAMADTRLRNVAPLFTEATT